MADPTIPLSICVKDMRGERALLSSNIAPPPLADIGTAVGTAIQQHYTMHTGAVLVDLDALHTWEYLRDIDEGNVEKLVANILVSISVCREQGCMLGRLSHARLSRSYLLTRCASFTRISNLPTVPKLLLANA